MKLTQKSLGKLLGLLFLGLVAGTLVWELLERVLTLAGATLDVAIGPITLDLHAVAVTLRVNPGSALGAAAGAVLFRAL